MQILPSTATMLGFEGSRADLSEPKTNIHFGVKYLAKAWQLSNGNLCRALMKYRAGHGEERFTPLSVEYCRRAREHLANIGAALPDASELPTPIGSSEVAAGPRVVARARTHSASPLDAAYRRELKIAQLQAARVFGRARSDEDSSRFWRAQQGHIRAVEARLKRRTAQLAMR
jgi:hypothetical protein